MGMTVALGGPRFYRAFEVLTISSPRLCRGYLTSSVCRSAYLPDVGPLKIHLRLMFRPCRGSMPDLRIMPASGPGPTIRRSREGEAPASPWAPLGGAGAPPSQGVLRQEPVHDPGQKT
jgi:hypothetical protein